MGLAYNHSVQTSTSKALSSLQTLSGLEFSLEICLRLDRVIVEIRTVVETLDSGGGRRDRHGQSQGVDEVNVNRHFGVRRSSCVLF